MKFPSSSNLKEGVQRRVCRGLLAFALFLVTNVIAVPSSAAAVFYVATNGSDSNPGTLSAPYRTLNSAVRVLKPGDTLYVKAGTYAESLFDAIPGGTSWSAPIKIAAYTEPTTAVRDVVTIQPPPGSYRVLHFSGLSSAYIIIDGFILDAVNVQYDAIKITYAGSDLNNSAHHIRIINCEVKNAPKNGILGANDSEFINLNIHHNGTTDFDHGLYIAGPNNLIQGSLIHNNAGWGVHIYNGAASTANNNTVRGNKIFNNARVGNRGPGIILSSGNGNKAYNNLIWGNQGGIQIDYGASNSTVYNNTVYANIGSGIYIGTGASNTILKNNIFYKNTTPISDNGAGTVQSSNLTTDPYFLNAANFNFQLMAGSPAIDAAVNLTEVSDDFDGKQRPKGPSYDIGAYEYEMSTNIPTSTAQVTVDSTFPGYATSSIHDGIINATGGTATTWASEDSGSDHWINIAFTSSTAINTATIFWAYNNYQQKYMTSQTIHLQYWDGQSYQTVGTFYSGSLAVPSSSITFPTVSTTQLRFYQPANHGNPGYPGVLWITEVEYRLDAAVGGQPPTAPSNLATLNP